MKKHLGRVFLILFILLHVETFASTYTWSAYSDKKSAYINEAVYLKYVCSFSDASELYTIEFNPAGEYKKFILKNLKQDESIIDGKRVNTYEFVAFAKSAGRIDFDFEALMKKTTKDSIENTVIGRDNVQKEEFTKKIIKQKSLSLDVKETNSSLVGEFIVEVKKDEPKIKEYEPYHLHVKIKGIGDFESLRPLKFKIDGVKVFESKAQGKWELGKNGEVGEWDQRFAFVSDKNFTIPTIKIEYFDLKDKKLDEMSVDATTVEVEKGFDKKELLDKDEQKDTFKFDLKYIYYLLFFAAGFLAAKIKIKKPNVAPKSLEGLEEKVKKAKSLEELMMILALWDSKKYHSLIIDIEQKRVISLNEAKKKLDL